MVTGHHTVPALELSASKVVDVSPTETTLAFYVSIRNHNPFTLALRHVDYRLRIGAELIAQGAQPLTVTVPAESEGEVVVSTRLAMDRLLLAEPTGMALGEVPYTLELHIVYGNWITHRDVEGHATSALRFDFPLGLAAADQVPSADS